MPQPRHDRSSLLAASLRLVFAFAAIAGPARAEPSANFTVRAWTLEDGLPTSTVQDIVQTPDGYLWLTTTGGLARFDGRRFEVFGPEQGLPARAALPASRAAPTTT